MYACLSSESSLVCHNSVYCSIPPAVVYNAIPGKQETLNRPPSSTLAQHQNHIGSTSRVCWVTYTHTHTRLYNTFAEWRANAVHNIRGRAKTKNFTGQMYLNVTGPPLKTLALIFIIKMHVFYDEI